MIPLGRSRRRESEGDLVARGYLGHGRHALGWSGRGPLRRQRQRQRLPFETGAECGRMCSVRPSILSNRFGSDVPYCVHWGRSTGFIQAFRGSPFTTRMGRHRDALGQFFRANGVQRGGPGERVAHRDHPLLLTEQIPLPGFSFGRRRRSSLPVLSGDKDSLPSVMSSHWLNRNPHRRSTNRPGASWCRSSCTTVRRPRYR